MSFDKVPNFLVNFFEADMNGSESYSYRFKSFLLNVSERQLMNRDKSVSITPKAFDVLTHLVKNCGHLVRKDELMQAVWPDSFVDEVNLPRTIHTLRRALGEDQNGSKFIETVPTKGYRFVAQVEKINEPVSESPFPLASEEIEPKDVVMGATNGLTEIASPPPAYSVISDIKLNENDYVTSAKPKQKTRIILFTVGFLTAVSLIVLLSFNLQSKSSNKSGFTQPRLAANDEAYRQYLLGSALTDKITPKDAEKAIEVFEQAITLDPNYAPAYAGLANAHNAIAFMGGGGNPTEEFLKAKAAVEKALALDDGLAEAHAYLGEIKTNFEWDFVGAEREHKRAVELNPNSAAAHRMYALLLGFLGRSDESVEQSKIAIDLEPASVLNHKIYQQNLFYARQYDEAIAEGKRTLELDAKFLGVFDTVIGSYLMKDEDDRAFEWFLRQEGLKQDKPEEIESWKTIYAQFGWPGIYDRQLELAIEAEKNGNTNPMPLARLYAKTSNTEQAFSYLEKAFDRRMQGMTALKVSPNFDSLRSDPRFDNLLQRIGLK